MSPSKSNEELSFAARLLEQDEVMSGPEYAAHRDQLAGAISTARWRERIAYRVCAISGVIAFTLMFVGGSGVLGSFDPASRDATVLSVGLGVIYVICMVTFCVLLASYYSRFRPGTRQAREDLRDWQLAQLESHVSALAKQVAELARESRGDGERSS